FALLYVAGDICGVRRRIGSVQNSGFTPTRPHLGDDHIDLLVGQQSACTLGESRHRSSGNALGDNFADDGIASDTEVNGIGECDGSPTASFRAVTAGAVFSVKSLEIQNFGRCENLCSLLRLPVR